MPRRLLRKKARTLKPPGHTLTSVTWGHPVKEPYPPTSEAAALLSEEKVQPVQPFQKASWWRGQSQSTRQRQKPKVEREKRVGGWWKNPKKDAMILTPLPLKPAFVTAPPAAPPRMKEVDEDPWHHHSRYFPEYTPIHPELTVLAENSQLTPDPLVAATTWQHI